jgi:hypothetical protein|uniref:Uncharacterized protein n=1 Tax=viral metagenome TaxID=1070528 RepID=A0A6C0D4Y7_9ZZZZ
MDILRSAIATYAAGPMLESDVAQIQYMNHALKSVLSGENMNCDDMVVTSDPGEETDDILMIRYILTQLRSKVRVILSGGVLNPDERFAALKRVFPEFADAQFGVPFGNITFLPDGVTIHDPVKCFVNCGPCHSVTLRSIFDRLNESRGRMITVGANSDGTAAGINQKQTDEGSLKDLNWNEYLATLKDVVIKNLDVGISRYVLLPHPSQISGPYGSMPSECFEEMVHTAAMFFASRASTKAPPKIVLRVNEGNSIIVSQHIDVMQPDHPAFAYGLELIQTYAAGSPYEFGVSAAIPLMATALMGGVYKEGVFGFDPKDKMAKEHVSCLTPESAQVFLSNIRKLEKFTPGYDLLAIILAQ